MGRLSAPPSPGSPEKLKLTEPSSMLWSAIRDRLDRLRQSYETRPESWMMGGGSILAARWRHRQSDDIDLTTSANWQIEGLDRRDSNVFTEAMKPFGGSLTGYRKGSIRMSFPHGRLHVYKVPPSPAAGNAVAAIDDRPFDVLSTTQILAGKLLNRLADAPARDLYDVAVASRRQPQQFEWAANTLSPETQRDAALIWHTRRRNIERDALRTLKPLSPDTPLEVPVSELVDTAIAALNDACYETIDIEPAAPGRPAQVITVTAGGESRRIQITRAAIDQTLERTGMNHCLAARYLDIDRFIDSLHIERE